MTLEDFSLVLYLAAWRYVWQWWSQIPQFVLSLLLIILNSVSFSQQRTGRKFQDVGSKIKPWGLQLLKLRRLQNKSIYTFSSDVWALYSTFTKTCTTNSLCILMMIDQNNMFNTFQARSTNLKWYSNKHTSRAKSKHMVNVSMLTYKTTYQEKTVPEAVSADRMLTGRPYSGNKTLIW